MGKFQLITHAQALAYIPMVHWSSSSTIAVLEFAQHTQQPSQVQLPCLPTSARPIRSPLQHIRNRIIRRLAIEFLIPKARVTLARERLRDLRNVSIPLPISITA